MPVAIKFKDLDLLNSDHGCELLLARLDILACYRYSAKCEIEEARHGVIRRLENKIFLKGKK